MASNIIGPRAPESSVAAKYGDLMSTTRSPCDGTGQRAPIPHLLTAEAWESGAAMSLLLDNMTRGIKTSDNGFFAINEMVEMSPTLGQAVRYKLFKTGSDDVNLGATLMLVDALVVLVFCSDGG